MGKRYTYYSSFSPTSSLRYCLSFITVQANSSPDSDLSLAITTGNIPPGPFFLCPISVTVPLRRFGRLLYLCCLQYIKAALPGFFLCLLVSIWNLAVKGHHHTSHSPPLLPIPFSFFLLKMQPQERGRRPGNVTRWIARNTLRHPSNIKRGELNLQS